MMHIQFVYSLFSLAKVSLDASCFFHIESQPSFVFLMLSKGQVSVDPNPEHYSSYGNESDIKYFHIVLIFV